MPGYLVVRQFQLGEARLLFGCQKELIGHEKYVIRSVSLFIQIRGSPGGYTVWAGEFMSTFKVFNNWLCYPSVSGRGVSGAGLPSGTPQECTWIKIREQVCSEGGGGVQNIHLLGANTFDNQLASKEVVRMFFLRMGVDIGLRGVTIESISRGKGRHKAPDGWAGSSGSNSPKKVA
jgi:hypothetical protein